ncbi:ROK family protein [Lederbergia lenta]|uniref:ROK family protein n=1 Tax=Lederbergia lenta TaxID=1467 RepID=A0A2X4WD70_LEDLE|nr:ROK family protein [Lederbergia lenta]MCM3111778.1 ROK family protein [Lederbergia lenta]MEC2322932.1 ROK family protein [Lederbergia lenta]SQI62066.1 ROK family protein [Lederbergia lenta]
MKLYSVMDIGGTYVKSAVMNERGEVVSEERIPTPEQGEGEIFKLIRSIVHRDINVYPAISGLALSVPAAVNVDNGYVSYAGSVTDLIGSQIKEELADLKIPIEVENDANCAALAEKWKGNAKDAESFLCVTVGTGIGGAIYLNNGILHGQEGMAGEFGLMLLNHSGEMDDLFAKWSFSRVASTWNMIDHLNKEFNISRTGEEWFQLYDNGDKEVAIIVERFYYRMSLGIINLMHIFAPEKIMVGGGLSERGDLIDFIRQQVAKVPTPIARKIKIEACRQGNQAGLIGALYHFLQKH